MMTPALTRLAAVLSAALMASLSGCALTTPLTSPTPQATTPVATSEPETSGTAVIRTKRPRLVGEEIDLRPKEVAARPSPGVVELGQRGPVRASATTGYAQTLREATRSVIPSEYAIRPASCVAQQSPASWTRTSDWINALEQVMLAHGLVAIVDHDLKQVLIDKPPVLDPNQPRDWAILRSDLTLRRALERWLTPACVQMEWDVPFPLDVKADRVYRGVSLWTALRTLAEELESSDAPIRIIQHPNVVRIASGQMR